eukprot:9690-Heterococcus_DN1.PRE.1
MNAAIARVLQQPPAAAQNLLNTLLKIVDNIIQHPLEEKYRSIKRSNKSFAARVGSVPGSAACMTSLGFTLSQDNENWILVPSATAWPTLQAGRANIQSAIAAASAATAAGGSSANTSSTFGSSIGSGMSGGMPIPQSPADIASAMAVLNNTQAMQAMMQNPMIQRMMAADPRRAQQMQAMMQQPGMMQQAMQELQRNPAMMQQAQQMMANNGDMNMMNSSNTATASSFGSGSTANTTTAATGTSATAAADDIDMTEDEMIAQAIARSMNEM